MSAEDQMINVLEAEVRELRAQIAAIEATDRRLIEENGRLQAHIAAKDAALRKGSSQWLLDAVANWKRRAEVAEAIVTEVEHMRESLAWYAKREADLLARAEKAEAQIAAKNEYINNNDFIGGWRTRAEKAEAQIAAKDARVRVLAVALEYALQKMWEYGFTENDLQPVRNALSIPKPRRLTPEEAGEIADSIEASLKGQDNG